MFKIIKDWLLHSSVRARWAYAGKHKKGHCWLPANAAARREFSGIGAYTRGVNMYFSNDWYFMHAGYRAHEYEHVKQYLKEGSAFEKNYERANRKYGYHNNPYEVAARKAAKKALRKAR